MALFAMGICDLIWYRMYKPSSSEAMNSYRAYLEIGKICIFGSSIILLLSMKKVVRVTGNYIHQLLALIIQFSIIIYSMYQAWFLGVTRIDFSLGGGANATGAAYTVTFLSFYIVMVIQYSVLKWKKLIILAHFVVTFLVLIGTGTRAAILTYPVIFFGLLLFSMYEEKKFLWKDLIVFFLAILICSVATKDRLTKRYDNFNHDIAKYSDNNSVSSMGARFAMWETGLNAAKDNYFWQSTDQRNEKIKRMISEKPELSGALPFIKGHLHNEIVEILSLKGPSGLLMYIFFIVSLGWYAVKRVKNPLLFSLLVSIVAYGVSGVMFYAKTTPVALMLTLIFMIHFLDMNNEKMK